MAGAARRAVPLACILLGAGLTGCHFGGRAASVKPGSEKVAAAKLIVTRSPDSLAPNGAPAHWLPPEPWVYNHWLPFDERRLYRLLGITREQLWQQLRDDHRTLSELASTHGWPEPARLAATLVAPERARVGAAQATVLQARAERVITQGHLAQHL